MTRLQERIELLSANSASILAQLNELGRLREQVRQAQAAAFESMEPKSGAKQKHAG
jgi:hypothetical protein